MALTRKLLKGMGLTDEQVDTIIEAHTDTVDGLKADVTRYKADAEKLPGIQKQLDDLKAAGDGGYKEKYEKEHSAFEAFKTDITEKESKAAKEKAVRAYFESKNITGANLDLAMRGCGEEMSALELDGEKIKDTKSLDALVDGTYKSLVSKPAVRLDMGGCNGLRFIGTLDKSKVSGIIKITKAPSARTVWPRLVNQLQVKLETVTLPSGGFGHLCGW